MQTHVGLFIHVIDLFGTASFALSGALRALHRRPDFVGMLILATAAAVGGGTLRDVLLRRDVAVLHNGQYPLVILAAVALVFLFPARMRRGLTAVKYADAVGLGAFSAITANLAWQSPGVSPLSVLFLATIAGCAGGAVRDVLIQEPTLVLANELYVTPAVIGTAGLMAARAFGSGELLGLAIAASLTTTIRILAIRNDWRLPRSARLEESCDPQSSSANDDVR